MADASVFDIFKDKYSEQMKHEYFGAKIAQKPKTVRKVEESHS